MNSKGRHSALELEREEDLVPGTINKPHNPVNDVVCIDGNAGPDNSRHRMTSRRTDSLSDCPEKQFYDMIQKYFGIVTKCPHCEEIMLNSVFARHCLEVHAQRGIYHCVCGRRFSTRMDLASHVHEDHEFSFSDCQQEMACSSLCGMVFDNLGSYALHTRYCPACLSSDILTRDPSQDQHLNPPSRADKFVPIKDRPMKGIEEVQKLPSSQELRLSSAQDLSTRELGFFGAQGLELPLTQEQKFSCTKELKSLNCSPELKLFNSQKQSLPTTHFEEAKKWGQMCYQIGVSKACSETEISTKRTKLSYVHGNNAMGAYPWIVYRHRYGYNCDAEQRDGSLIRCQVCDYPRYQQYGGDGRTTVIDRRDGRTTVIDGRDGRTTLIDGSGRRTTFIDQGHGFENDKMEILPTTCRINACHCGNPGCHGDHRHGNHHHKNHCLGNRCHRNRCHAHHYQGNQSQKYEGFANNCNGKVSEADDRPHRCHVCRKRFPNKASLRTHRASHVTSSPPPSLNFRAIVQAYDMSTTRPNSGDVDIKRPELRHSWPNSKKEDKRQHIRKKDRCADPTRDSKGDHHPSNQGPKFGKIPWLFICSSCGKQFQHKSRFEHHFLRRHIVKRRTKRRRSRRLWCKYCGIGYRRLPSFKAHMQKHVGFFENCPLPFIKRTKLC